MLENIHHINNISNHSNLRGWGTCKERNEINPNETKPSETKRNQMKLKFKTKE
jgi:hypothetical protein